MISLVVLPKENAEETVYSLQFAPSDAQILLARFQTPGESEAAEHVSQVYVSLVEFDTEISFDEGDVETLAVVSDENVILRDPPLEIIQVITIDVMEYGAPVVESDRRYRFDESRAR